MMMLTRKKPKNKNKKKFVDYEWRFAVVILTMLCAAVLVAGRSAYWAIVDKDMLNKEGDERIIAEIVTKAPRGLITDRNGEPLAVSTPVVTIVADPKALLSARASWAKSDKEKVRRKVNEHKDKIRQLTAALGRKPDELENYFKHNPQSQYWVLKQDMPPHEADALLALGAEGIYGSTSYKRFYPAREVMAQVLGFTRTDGTGQEGLELYYESMLKGQDGVDFVDKDRVGNIIRFREQRKPLKPGQTLQMSVDLHAQYFAYRELERAYKEFSAGPDQTPKSASLVALDVETGEVIAMASYPSFNPNDRRNLKPVYTRNRPIVDLYEPGSTVKAFTVAAGLESGKYTPDTLIDASARRMMVQGHIVEDVHNYGVIDVRRVITKSSNIGAAQIALNAGAERMLSMFHRVGFGDMSNIQFPGEPVGRMLDVNDKKQFELATLSFGYGLSVSSLQLAQAYAVIASGGVKRQVTFEKQSGMVSGEQVIDPRTARDVAAMLETVVSAEGTALKAKVPGYRVAGKTGTVHKTSDRGGYEADVYRSVFCGFAPASQPKIAMVVMIDEPKTGAYYGGVVAAPVFSRVMSNLLRVMNVPPDDVQDPSKSLAGLNPDPSSRL